jgi:hypothetical protein
VWGQVATVGSVQVSLCVAAATGALTLWVANRWMPHHGAEEDLTPARAASLPLPAADEPPASGQVLVSLEYRIEPARADEFRALMLESRRSRLSHGALVVGAAARPRTTPAASSSRSWTRPGTTTCAASSRLTAADAALRERKLAFHLGESPPVVTRSVMESTVKGG